MKPAWALAVLLATAVPAEAQPITAPHHSFGAIVEGFAVLIVLMFTGCAVHELYGAVRDQLRK